MLSNLAGVRWFLFAIYLLLFVSLPFSILFGRVGMWFGFGLFAILMGMLRYRAADKISLRMGSIPLPSSLAPSLYHLVKEHCRRAGLSAVPRLEWIPSPALNAAVFGFSQNEVRIVLTQGLIDTLSRDELSRVLSLEIAWIKSGDYFCHSWLSQFMALLDRAVLPGRDQDQSRKVLTFQAALRHALIVPLVLFPFVILRGGTKRRTKMGELELSLPLCEALRKIETAAVRNAFQAPFSVRHLFIHVPHSQDPVVRLLMAEDSESSLAAKVFPSLGQLSNANAN